MSTLVAATMRMLVFCTVEEPTFMNSPLSSTPEQTGLGGKRQFGYLVEKYSAAVGLLEVSFAR